MMRRFEMTGGSSREQGRAHGEHFRGEIRSLAELRTYLCARISGNSAERVMELAAAHVPVLYDYDRNLAEELVGIAEGAAVDPAAIVVINHYTDLRDLRVETKLNGDVGDGCSAFFTRTPEGPVSAQTWDTHASVIPYVMMLRVAPRFDEPGAWLLSITGCLGMAGLNSAGVAVAINNLAGKDARIAPVWPAVVRRALAMADASAARDRILSTEFGSGRHYLVADEDHAFGIEGAGSKHQVVYSGEADSYVHTNHCLEPTLGEACRVPSASTTYDRYRILDERFARGTLSGMDEAWRLLGSHDGYPKSVCTNMTTPETPHGVATCAAVAFDHKKRQLWACAGFSHHVAPEVFQP